MSQFTFDWILDLLQQWLENLTILTMPLGKMINNVVEQYFNISLSLPPVLYNVSILGLLVPNVIMTILIIHAIKLIRS